MDIKNRMLLQHHQQDIVKDLDVTYILDELFTKKVITNEEFDHIYNLTNRVERTRYLLDIIIQNGNNETYESFVDSLAKDHKWLWEKLAVKNINEPMLNDSFEDSLSRGDVPRLPDYYVRRNNVEEDVATKLKLLTRHNFLVIHGMSGSGKTVVAVSALRDNPELITNCFSGVVFWLNFGNCKTEDDIIAQQNKLHRKASSIYSHNSYMNSTISMSSIGSNADSHSLSNYDRTWQDLRDILKKQFSGQTLKESLLVLDEVNEKKFVEAFDIGCKILITTRDTDVVSNFHPQIITIENSFQERETLELFASCLDIEVSKLPRQAKKLHELCKGSPFNIALIGAQLSENKERFIHDTSLWNYYVNKLEKKDFFFLSRHTDNPMKTVEICINSLNSRILPLFKSLEILPDNVKVTSRVLGKLWNKDVSEVEPIMKQLRSKSLIIELYDHDQRNYIYEIHDLIMNYLKTCSNDEEKKKLHADFLKSYGYDNINNVPVEIPDDGYIAFYIGYHIWHTKNLNDKWKLFKLFLDLKFLGNKVKLTGPADVILDLQKYETHIAQDLLDRELLSNIKVYLSTHGTDLYRYPCTDILQSILQHESKGILYTKASQIAQEKCAKNELYFEFLHEHDVEEIKHSTIDVKDGVRAVCFLRDYILVGTDTGVIKVFHISTNKLFKELTGTGFPIKWLGACPINPPIVAALSLDGFIKLWYIDDLEQDIIEEEPEETPNNNYPCNVTIPSKLGPFLSCKWANNSETLITHTSQLIILYKSDGKVLKVLDNMGDILCCVLSNNDTHAIIATNTHKVDVIDLTTKERIVTFRETDPVVEILTIPGSNRIVLLKANEIIEHEFKINTNSYQNNYNIPRRKIIITSDEVKENLTFLSIAVNKSGTLLFVSTNDSRIICIDLKTYLHIFDLENRRGNVVSMAMSEVWYDFLPGSDVLLTGTGTKENSAKVWFLDTSYVSQATQKNGKVRLTTKFDVSFVNTMSPQTPGSSTPSSDSQSTTNSPKRHQSFVSHKEMEKRPAKKTLSLDRLALKPLNLKGICNRNEGCFQPLLAVVDDKNNIQVIRGRKVLTEISTKPDDYITTVKISPCNQYVIYGLRCGSVMKYTLRTKETKVIVDVYSPVQYLNFVTPNLLMVAGKNRCLMAYRFTGNNYWMPQMLQHGNTNLGSQELLNDLHGIKKKNGQSEMFSSSGSENSLSSKDRVFSSGDINGQLAKCSRLVDCVWIHDVGLITIESNASIKFWDQELKLINVLNGRQKDVNINCAAFQKNILVICDDYNNKFQTFELKEKEQMVLQAIQEYKLNNRITSCALSADGYVLALGLDSGDVVLWNVPGKRQLRLLKHHKTKVQWCLFSPVPDNLLRSTQMSSPHPAHTPMFAAMSDDDQPPLVLVTMASEIVWWNISYLIKMRANKNIGRTTWNVVSPLASPLENKNELPIPIDNLNLGTNSNIFFGDGPSPTRECWKVIWKQKTCKEASKKKEILACIKLSGMNAKKLCHDDKFSCFVTVDNPGHIHIMNVMMPNNT